MLLSNLIEVEVEERQNILTG